MWVTGEQLVVYHGYDITKLEVEEFNGGWKLKVFYDVQMRGWGGLNTVAG
jgi:hypothetical protein